MAFFRKRARSVTIFLISSVIIPIVLSKSCKKLDACKCEMDDGSGVINLWELDNPDGTPRFTDIQDADPVNTYTYNYNPCTPMKSTGAAACEGSNLCQSDSGTYYPCDGSFPSFTVDDSNHVVMTYTTRTGDDGYTRTSKITLACDKKNEKGSVSPVSQKAGEVASATYSATLTAKSACPVPSNVPSNSSSSSLLSTGSIILIIFFPLVLLYLIFGILFNIYVRHKQSVPDVLPNHTFWADFPFLVKDGCVFSCGKMKYCCCLLYFKAKGQEYSEI